MNILDELYGLYLQVDGSLSITEATARAQKNSSLEEQTARQRKVNDQAFFLYMFTRLEEKIREATKQMFEEKISSSADQKELRAWEILKANDRLTLMTHVSFFLPIGSADYQLIRNLKKQRDEIAHGGMPSTAVISDCFVEMSRLNKSFC